MPGTVGRVPNPAAPVSGTPSASGTAAAVPRHDWAGTPLGAWRTLGPGGPGRRPNCSSPRPCRWPSPWATTTCSSTTTRYAELIGDRHPDAVGRPAAEVFAESWPLPGVGDAIERTYRSGEPFLEKETTLPLHRRPGLVEQSVFTRGYSPVRDSAGRIVGVLTVAAETTQVTQQLQSLSDFAAALAGTLTLDDVARVALRYAITAFDADQVSFAVDEGGGGWRMVRRIRGELMDEADERLPPLWRRVPPDWPGPVVTGARSGVPLVRRRRPAAAGDRGGPARPEGPLARGGAAAAPRWCAAG